MAEKDIPIIRFSSFFVPVAANNSSFNATEPAVNRTNSTSAFQSNQSLNSNNTGVNGSLPGANGTSPNASSVQSELQGGITVGKKDSRKTSENVTELENEKASEKVSEKESENADEDLQEQNEDKEKKSIEEQGDAQSPDSSFLRNVPEVGTLDVSVSFINDNGGTGRASDVIVTVTGDNNLEANPKTFHGNEDGTSVKINAGARYKVIEENIPPQLYSATFSSGCSGEFQGTETRLCKITNDDITFPFNIPQLPWSSNPQSSPPGQTGQGNAQGPAPATHPGPSEDTTGQGTPGQTGQGTPGQTGQGTPGQTGQGTPGQTGQGTPGQGPAQLRVIKHVINDDGGTKKASDFTLHVYQGGYLYSAFQGDEAGTELWIDPGAQFIVAELRSSAVGYTITWSNDCSGNIVEGRTMTCTFTNNDIASSPSPGQGTQDEPTTAPYGGITVDRLPTQGPFIGQYAGPTVNLSTIQNPAAGSLKPSDSFNNSLPTPSVSPLPTPSVGPLNNSLPTPSVSPLPTPSVSPLPTPSVGPLPPPTAVEWPDCLSSNECRKSYESAAATFNGCEKMPSTGSLLTSAFCSLGKLIVITHVINDNGGKNKASDFLIQLSGNNVVPFQNAGKESPGMQYYLGQGSYFVMFSTATGGYEYKISDGCQGTIKGHQTLTCIITASDS